MITEQIFKKHFPWVTTQSNNISDLYILMGKSIMCVYPLRASEH